MRRRVVRRPWSEEEIKVLKEHYGRIPTIELAKALNRSIHAIQSKARALDLKFPKGNEIDYELLKKLVEVYEG